MESKQTKRDSPHTPQHQIDKCSRQSTRFTERGLRPCLCFLGEISFKLNKRPYTQPDAPRSSRRAGAAGTWPPPSSPSRRSPARFPAAQARAPAAPRPGRPPQGAGRGRAAGPGLRWARRVWERRAASSERAPKEARGAGRAQTLLTGFQSGQKLASRRPPPEENEKSAFWGARSPSTARAQRSRLSLEGGPRGGGPAPPSSRPGPEGGHRGRFSAAQGVGADAAGPADLRGGGGRRPRRPGKDSAAASTTPRPPSPAANERLPVRR